MNPRAIIVHGTGGSPEGNWFPWLATQLEDRGITALRPGFPTPENQSFQNWRNVFDVEIGPLRPSDILIGHSIGAGFVCRILEQQSVRIKAAFLVAGFAKQLGNPDFDPYNRTFVEHSFDWDFIKSRSRKFFVYNGDDDPYVPLCFREELAESLQTPLYVAKGGGHLNAESGHRKLPFLLADLEMAI